MPGGFLASLLSGLESAALQRHFPASPVASSGFVVRLTRFRQGCKRHRR
jgi:hypothetical protein